MSKLSSNQLQEDQVRRGNTFNLHRYTKRLNTLMKPEDTKIRKKTNEDLSKSFYLVIQRKLFSSK